MKLNRKDSQRTLHIVANGGDGYLLTERLRYVPYGYSKAKWEHSQIWIQADELRKALESVDGGKQ